ncbi:TetR/AcrR family transcriptional regulator [Nonomuraea sp. NN258]|uniref:TetR/AcrR family transcriptional regulator n=1 Tax=Nonomuraea antri TaxID=2730852 RepID=UPI00156A24DE|nr:TetR/AcrR family transcriptional regulator [Nonomuraea antri]NRQ38916.1 TetR/AcrR family transcriptional regulator [Nonomuraea antri]
MPPAFTAEEKTRITALLLETGRHLFTSQGLRKTSLEELMAPTGVAKSSFYVFFDSKEDLYLELMVRQSAEVKRKVIDAALLSAPDPREGLRRFLHATLDELSANPLWRRLMTHPEEMQAVARKLDPARITAMADNPVTALNDYLTRHQGDLVAADPAVITGVLQCVLLVPMFADRLGDPAQFPKILGLLVDIVAAGLTSQKE